MIQYPTLLGVLANKEHLGTAQATSAAGGDETDLATLRAVALDRRRVTNVLMVTTTVRVLNRVHGNTTDLKTGTEARKGGRG